MGGYTFLHCTVSARPSSVLFLQHLCLLADMGLPEAVQSTALWQICLIGRMQVLFILTLFYVEWQLFWSNRCLVQSSHTWRVSQQSNWVNLKIQGNLTSAETGRLTLFSWADGRPAPPMKGQLRRKQEREVLAVSINTFTFSEIILFLFLTPYLLSVTMAFSLTETYRDAEFGVGQRNRDVEWKTTRGWKSQGAQEVSFTET